MKSLLEKKYVTAGFAASLIILLLINYLAYRNITDHFEDESFVNETMMTIQTAEVLLAKLTDAETNRRGYLITSNEEFLTQYNIDVNKVDSVFIQLKKVTLDDTVEIGIMDSLYSLINYKREIFKESIELQEQKARNKVPTSEIAFTEKSRVTQDKIVNLISELQHEENNEMMLRNKKLNSTASLTITGQIIGTVVSFVILIIGFVMLRKEITNRKKYEKDIEDSMNWFRTTLSSIGDAVIVTNHVGDITFMNRVAESLTGWSEEEVRGMYLENVFDIVNEETGEKAENPVKRVFNSGTVSGLSNHTMLINKKGDTIPIDDTAAPIISKDNKLLGVVLVFRDITARRMAEDELVKSRRFTQKIADSTPNVLFVFRVEDFEILYVNPQIEKILGYKPENVKSMGSTFFSTLMHPDDYIKFKSANMNFKQAGENHVIETSCRLKNPFGEWRWFDCYNVVFESDEEGMPSQMLCTALDITDKKRLEEEIRKYSGHLEEIVEKRTAQLLLTNEKLQEEIIEKINAEKSIAEAEQRFRTLVEYSLAGIYIIQDFKLTYTNPKMEEIFGYNKNGMIGKNILDMVCEDDKVLVEEHIKKQMDGSVLEAQYSYEALKKDGKRIYVEVRGTKIMYNSRISVIGTIHDITERRTAEEEIRKQREFLRLVIDTNPSFIFAKDWEGRFTLVNQAVANAYGTTVQNLIGKTDADFNRKKEEVEHFLKDDREVMTTLKPKLIPEETVSNAATGEAFWYQTIKIPLVSAHGRKQVLGVSTDITARKKAEEDIRKSLREKELLLKEVHHRVKNNLQVIVSLLKLQAKYIFDKRDLDLFNKSRARVETMSLIHEKLYKSPDIANINIGTYIKELVNHLLQVYGFNYKDISLCVEVDDIRTAIDTAIPCGLIVNEVVSNSLKHAFSLDNPDKKLFVELKKDGEDIILNICDNGIGIPGDFDFSKVNSLGLQLVNTLVKQLDGVVLLEHEHGTTFSFRFKELRYRERI